MSAAFDLARRVLARPATGVGQDATPIGLAQLAAALTEGRAAGHGWVWAAALTVGIVPFAAYATLILYHFYIKGAFLWDSGLLAYLVGASDPRLPVPPIMTDGSFFAIHMTPIFVALSPLRTVLLPTALGPGPFGAKAAGELTNNAVAPAVANAVEDAIGVRVRTMPVTAERVYAALAARQTDAAS